jgi:hypothetical protein
MVVIVRLNMVRYKIFIQDNKFQTKSLRMDGHKRSLFAAADVINGQVPFFHIFSHFR